MKALVNLKICDNAPECGGIQICPTKAMYFDEVKNSIVVDEKKCINCGLCEKECPIGAIMVGKNEEQYQQYLEQIENDSRTTKDLFVDRYGAVALSEFFQIEADQLEQKIDNPELLFIECFDSEIAECLLKSIPIKEITDKIIGKINYYKLDKDDEVAKKYDIEEFPTLLIFRDKELLGRVVGYYAIDAKKEFEEKIKKNTKNQLKN